MATDQEKGRELLRKKFHFPEFSIMEYKLSMIKNLNYYNSLDDTKQKKEWTLKYWKDEKKDITGFNRIHDGYFNTVGAIAHMIKDRKIDLDVKDISYLDRKYQEFKNQVSLMKSDVVSSSEPEKSKEEKYADDLKLHLAEFDYGMDMFFSGKSFDAKSYILKNGVKTAMSKDIANFYKPELKLLKSISTSKDEQLVESYSFMSTRQLNKYIGYIQTLISACEVATAISKASRKPRAKKVKSPNDLVKSVKWLIEDETTKIKSVHPSSIIDCAEAWVYNISTRRLFRYVALPSLRLTIKGTTINNIDAAKSGGRIIRKPTVQLSGIQGMTSRSISKLFTDINGTESTATGRLSEDTIIIKTF